MINTKQNKPFLGRCRPPLEQPHNAAETPDRPVHGTYDPSDTSPAANPIQLPHTQQVPKSPLNTGSHPSFTDHRQVTKMQDSSPKPGARDTLSYMTTVNHSPTPNVQHMLKALLNLGIKLAIHTQSRAIKNMGTWRMVILLTTLTAN